MKINKAHLFLLSTTAATLILWGLSKMIPGGYRDPVSSLSEVLAFMGLLYLMFALILSTRSHLIEEYLGGLDKVYHLHQVIGGLAFVFLIFHPLFLAVNALPDWHKSLSFLFPGTAFSQNLGVYALYLLLATFLLAVAAKTPYPLWKRGHLLLGLAGIAGGLHSLIVPGGITYLPLVLWIGGWIFLGTVSFLYILLHFRSISDIFIYEVTRVERERENVSIYGKPVEQKIRFQPGQFGFFVFGNPQVGPEEHLFSLSGAMNEEEIRISAKTFGDFASRLPSLKPGDRMFVKGPYGKQGDVYIEGRRPLVWIVAGIGINPFLSMMHNESRLIEDRKIILFSCFSAREQPVFSDEINRLLKEKKAIEVYEWCSVEKNRITPNAIADILRRFGNYDIKITGPGWMVELLRGQISSYGLDDSRIHYDSFRMM